jgi:hypothetical protein
MDTRNGWVKLVGNPEVPESFLSRRGSMKGHLIIGRVILLRFFFVYYFLPDSGKG